MNQVMYVGAPVFGQALEVIEESFTRGAKLAGSLGYEPLRADLVSPPRHSGPCPAGRPGMENHSECCHLKADLRALLMCSAALFMHGWSRSWGCKLEFQVATAAGIPVYVECDDGAVLVDDVDHI